MKKMQQILITLTTLILSTSAYAQVKDEVLFKIHDVKPIKNVDGQTTACEFGATFFNRTSKNLSNIVIDLNWEDNVVAETIETEKKEQSNSIFAKKNNSRTESFNSKNISTQIALQPIPSMKQLSTKNKIDTDRCFLLLEKVQHKINSCKATVLDTSDPTQIPDTDDCKSMFIFVDSANPQYYNDFQAIAYSEQVKNEDSSIQRDAQEIDRLFQENKAAVEKLTKTLDSMK